MIVDATFALELLAMQNPRPCETCMGGGADAYGRRCPTCDGEGVVYWSPSREGYMPFHQDKGDDHGR